MRLRGCLPAGVSCNYVPLRGNVLEIGERKRKGSKGERESEQIEKMQVKMSDVPLDCNLLYYTIPLHCCQL